MKLLPTFVVTLLVLLGAVGCVLQADREISVEYVYPDSQRTELTIRYRVPPPPSGKVYVLWLLDAEDGKRSRGGVVQPSQRIRTIKTSVDYRVTGVVVSIESSPEASQMSNTWALKSGRLSDSER